MKIYLASRYANKPVMCEARDRLVDAGHTVVSSWIDEPFESINDIDDQQRMEFALRDISDLRESDAVVLYTTGGGSGCHHEFGFAMALKKILLIVGRRENIFHYLGRVDALNSTEELIGYLNGYLRGVTE